MRKVWRFLTANLTVNRALNRLLSGEVFGAIIHRREKKRMVILCAPLSLPKILLTVGLRPMDENTFSVLSSFHPEKKSKQKSQHLGFSYIKSNAEQKSSIKPLFP